MRRFPRFGWSPTLESACNFSDGCLTARADWYYLDTMSSSASAKRPRLWVVGGAPPAQPASEPPPSEPGRDSRSDEPSRQSLSRALDPAVPQSQVLASPKANLAFDDSELLHAVHEGDPSAAAALHDRVRPQVDRTIRRLLGGGDVDHEDLVQLALIEIVQSIDRFRGDCSLDGWTSTVASHVVYKHIRRRKTERRLFGGSLDDEGALPPAAVVRGHEAATRSTLRRVLDHIGAVEEVKAWTYVLHDVLGYDLKEIARITNASVAAAQTRLVRGRREVHERIAADPELANLLEDLGGQLP